MNYGLWLLAGLFMLGLFLFGVHLANKQDKEKKEFRR